MDAPYDIYDYQVQDRNGRKLGPLTGFWIDTATSQPEWGSVKTGWIMGKNHLVPLREARIDHARRTIQLPFEERQVRDAPGVPAEADLSAEEEERVYAHYGIARSRRQSPTGLPGQGAGTRPGIGGTPQRQSAEIPLHEERVNVGKRTVEEGVVRLRKVIRTEVREIPVELRRERVDIERVPASEMRGRGAPGEAFREREVTMTERREEPVVEKTSEVVGGVRATKHTDTQRENVRTEVRREDVEIDQDDRDTPAR